MKPNTSLLMNRLVLLIAVVAVVSLGITFVDTQHLGRTTLQTFYAMGKDVNAYEKSNWHVELYGADHTDFDELFRRTPLTALTNQVYYEEKNLDKQTDPFLEIYRTNPNSSLGGADGAKTVVLRRWCRDLPFDGQELADLIATQVESSGLLPPTT